MPTNISTEKVLRIIEGAFKDVPLPAEEKLTRSLSEEAKLETDPFVHKTWQELGAQFVGEHYDALTWFSPHAFRYYLPAFLKASLEIDPERAIYVGSFLSLLEPIDNPTLRDFRRERLGLMGDNQLQAIEQWLCWLSTKAVPGGIFHNEINVAQRNLHSRWWCCQ